MKRSGIADAYKMDCARFFEKRFEACAFEIPLDGSFRADVLAVNSSGTFTIVEVKSCKADFKNDLKWAKYLRYCHRFYFCSDPQTLEFIAEKVSATEHVKSVGLIAIDPETHELTVVRRPKTRNIDVPRAFRLMRLMIWANRP